MLLVTVTWLYTSPPFRYHIDNNTL